MASTQKALSTNLITVESPVADLLKRLHDHPQARQTNHCRPKFIGT
ncbi:hypothetical protein PSYAR_30843, partial [Pseudomonas syringae pv. aceris str. M302273]